MPRVTRSDLASADRLHSAAIHLLRQVRREDDASALSAPRLSALSVAVFAGPLTLGALAEAEQVRPPTMSRLVDALERDGLVVREPDTADARLVRIRATRKGVRVMQRGRARRVAILAAQLRALEPAERLGLDQAAAILERLASALAGQRAAGKAQRV